MDIQVEIIRGYLSELVDQVRKNFSRWDAANFSLDDPDFEACLAHWRHELESGEVPEAFGDLTFDEARVELPDRLHHAQLVQVLHADVERGIAAMGEAAQLRPGAEDHARVVELRAQGSDQAAQELEYRLQHMASESGKQTEVALVDLLEGLRVALGLLAGVSVADLVQGHRRLLQSRTAAKGPKYARGIQQATNKAYKPGMTERQCWKALLEYDGCEVDIEGWAFDLYRDGPTFYQVDLATGKTRGIKQGSFYAYFRRAKERAT